MTTTAYQPGPWQLRETIFGPAVDSEIGMVTGPIGLSEQKLATAQLIAAAPELLAALEMIKGCYLVKDGINGQLMWLTHQSVVEAVDAAIAKAKGN